MRAKVTEERRSHIFLAVLVSHAVIVLLLVRTSRQEIFGLHSADQPLVLMVLHELARATAPGKPRRPAPESTTHPAKREPAPRDAIAPPLATPAPSEIDWEHEAELAAQDAVAAAEKEKNYRDLAALSRAQLEWIRQNNLQPAPDGIHWKTPRVEVMPGGFPIVHINDHCVLVPMMMMMVFCKIGHIEADGGLFKHMRDPQVP